MNELKFKIDIKYLILSIVILCINVVLVPNIPVMGILAYFQFIILLYFLFFRDISSFISVLLLFTATSFEVKAYVNTDSEFLYSISNLPLLGFTGYFLILILAIYLLLLRNNFTFKIANTNQKLLLKFAIYIIFSGVIGGLICLLTNDNGVPPNILFIYLKQDFAIYTGTTLLIILLILALNSNPEILRKLKEQLYTLTIALVLVTIISVALGFYGTYGKDDIILMPLTSFYTILIIFFAFRKDLFNQKVVFLLFLVTLYFQFTYSTALGGKSWLLLIFLVMLILLVYYKKGYKLTILFGLSIFIVVFAFIVTTVLPVLIFNTETDLIARKVVEALSLFDFSSAHYFDNISESPKNRIDEFINITYEFKEKPFYAIFGKGFGGTIQDHNNYFGSFLIAFYRDEEYMYNAFCFMHESINNIFLKFGLVGMFMFLKIIYNIIRNKEINAFIAIGIVWLLFFYGYTNSLAIFGITGLLIGWHSQEEEDSTTLAIENEDSNN